METGFDFADLVDEAVQRSGGEQSTAQDVINVARSMRLLTERWIADGYNTWRITQKTELSAGRTPELPLPVSVDDVISISRVLASGSTGSTLTRITADEYASLGNRFTRGTPSSFYLQRSEPPVLFLSPIGEARLHVWYVERPAAFDRHDHSTDDVPGRWLEALTLGLAADLAKKRPPYDEQLIARLEREATAAEARAQRADRDRTRYRMRMGGYRRAR